MSVVDAFFKAMVAGASGGESMFGLFHDDAVYIEPFGGSPTEHVGLTAIRLAMETGWKTPLPDMTLSVDRVDVDGERVTAAWTCRSPALPGGAASGVNHFVLREGRIARLETRFA